MHDILESTKELCVRLQLKR